MAFSYTANPFPRPWPYVVGQPAPQPCVDTVRFLIGDTLASDQQFQDSEISGLLAQNNGSPYQAAIEGCRALAAHYARQVDKAVGDLRISASERQKSYECLADSLQKQAIRHDVPVPYAGGISQSDKTIDEDDSDVVAPSFTKGMMDDPGTAPDFSMLVDGFSGFRRAVP